MRHSLNFRLFNNERGATPYSWLFNPETLGLLYRLA
jgi:hypothetical protein